MNQDHAQLRVFVSLDNTFRRVRSSASRTRFMGTRMLHAVMALLLFGIVSRQAVCQFAHQGVLLSRPASVVLIAKVESLSVEAAPVASLSALPSAIAPDTQSMSITTRWALPRNLTTLRVTVYRDASLPGRAAAAPGSAEGPSPLAIGPRTADPRSAAPSSGQTVLLQGSGDSDQQTIRTDHLEIAPNPNKVSRKLTNKGVEEGTKRVDLVVQAL